MNLSFPPYTREFFKHNTEEQDMPLTRFARTIIDLLAALFLLAPSACPQSQAIKFDSDAISGLGARNIGSATMSGRISAVTAAKENGRLTVYIGAASGGIWKSVNGGTTYKPMFDKQTSQSIGAIAIDPQNPKTIWVGSAQDAAQQNSAPQNFTIQVLMHGFTPTGSMQTARQLHTASLLSDGRVLVTGGSGDSNLLASAEIYDPASGMFSSTGDMGTVRVQHTATTLNDGRVLVTGGLSAIGNNIPVASAEIFDPAKGTFAPTGSMATPRFLHVATLLDDGRVLVTGGFDGTHQLSTAELFDPTTGNFTPDGSMVSARLQHTATLLKDGRVLVTGGVDLTGTPIASAEIFDPASNTFTATGTMTFTRWGHSATLLCDLSSATCNNPKVFVTGGTTSATAEVFDPSTETFTTVGTMETMRSLLTATLLPDGTVLVAGGQQPNTSVLSSAELYDPATGNFTPAADMSTARDSHTATMLKTGSVLVTGGIGGPPHSLTTLATAELYK